MSNKLYNNDTVTKKNPNYGLLCFIAQIFVVIISVVSLIFIIGIDKNVDKLIEPVVVTGEPVTTNQPIEGPIDTSVVEDTNIVDITPETSLETGESYDGAFSEELESLGLNLKKITNLEDYMGEGYEGNVYTLEVGEEILGEMPTNISFDEFALDVKDTDGFSALNSKCVETEDEMGKIYTMSDEEGDYFFIRGLSDEIHVDEESEHLHYNVAYFCIKDYNKCKDLGIALGDITINSTLTEVVKNFGNPTYLDIYQPNEGASYIMMYYSKQNVETYTVDEMSLIFEINELAPNGYFLSEATVSIF